MHLSVSDLSVSGFEYLLTRVYAHISMSVYEYGCVGVQAC